MPTHHTQHEALQHQLQADQHTAQLAMEGEAEAVARGLQAVRALGQVLAPSQGEVAADLAQGLLLELADALPRQVVVVSYLLEGHLFPVLEAVAPADDGALHGGEHAEDLLHLDDMVCLCLCEVNSWSCHHFFEAIALDKKLVLAFLI